MDNHKECRKCSTTGNDLVMLWDGHAYCSSCLDAAHPALADYARHHPVLSEELPKRVKSQLPTFWTVFLHFARMRYRWTVVFLIVLVFFMSYQSSSISAFLFCGLILLLPMVTTFVMLYCFPTCFTRPKADKVSLSVTKGIVEISRDEKVVTFPLASSMWTDCSGSLFESYPFLTAFQDGPILTVHDNRFRCMLKNAISMCGFDDESRERWFAFLKLAGIPVHHPK